MRITQDRDEDNSRFVCDWNRFSLADHVMYGAFFFIYKQRNHSSCKFLDICDLVNHRHHKYTLDKMSEEHEVSIFKLYRLSWNKRPPLEMISDPSNYTHSYKIYIFISHIYHAEYIVEKIIVLTLKMTK